MTIEMIINLTSAIGTVFAGIALIVNFLQFQRLEKTIRGNTYQQLAQYAFKIKGILLDHPEVQYVYTMTSNENRSQEIFDRLIGNYLEAIWFQKKYGLIDEEMWQAYHELVKTIIKSHPSIAKDMMGSNYAITLREYIQNITQEITDSVAVK